MPGTLTPCQQCRDIPITVTPLGVPKAASPEHPKTFLLGFCRSRKRCWVLPASLQAAANFLTPSGPVRQGLYPPPMSLFIKNFIFSFYSEQNDEAQWRGGGGGDAWDHQQLQLPKEIRMRVFQEAKQPQNSAIQPQNMARQTPRWKSRIYPRFPRGGLPGRHPKMLLTAPGMPWP